MKKFYVSLLIVLSFLLVPSVNVSAQKNFIDGYIITLKKDTLKGKIDYREWNLNPSLIHFTDAAGKIDIFRPDDIAGFFIPPKDHYISSHVSLDLSSFQTKDLMEYQEPKLVRDTALFLMTLVKGKASLYYFNDRNNREHYYVSKDDAPLVELLLKKSYIKSSEEHTEPHGYVATVELFKGQLIALFNDCPELKEIINTLSYSIASIRSIVIRYNECIHSPLEFVKKEESIKFKFGLLAGPTLTKISFRGGSDDLTGVKMSDCYSFLAGVSFQIIFPLERAQWVLENELVYKPYDNKASISEVSWTNDKYDKNFSFKMGYLKLYTLLRYQYPKWKIRPFADFGMSNSYAIRSSDTKTIVIAYAGTNDKMTTTGAAIKNPKLYEFGILGGVGISWWKISGEVRYEWAQGMSPQFGFSGPENTLYFVASYLF
ncbi:MAG: hypothetical protein ABSE72_05825 [Bacteroidales bacterium]|jgi:hypothetical protein